MVRGIMSGRAVLSDIGYAFGGLFFVRAFRRQALQSGLLTICLAAGPSHGYAMGDPIRGEKLYEDSCKACHALDRNGIGPKHRGIFGRAAGTVRDYTYSAELQNSKIVWTEDALDKWLADSQTLVPGNKMFFPVDDAQERSDLIAFLKEKAK
jgi:cytochrome c